jgi:hypothetical protein
MRRAVWGASWRTCIASLALLAACEPSVSARAVWVDGSAAEDDPRVHVYDRGVRRELALALGPGQTITSMQLGPRAGGLLVRVGDRRAAWIDLRDARRLPVLLPPAELVGSATVELSDDGSALLWRELDLATQQGRVLALPLAPGLPLERDAAIGMVPLARAGQARWLVSARAAPVMLVAGVDDRLALVRWPDAADEAMQLRELAVDLRADRTLDDEQPSTCNYASASAGDGCVTAVGLDPAGELAIVAGASGGDWQRFDRRAPLDGALVLPDALAAVLDIDAAGLGLVQVLARDRSVWLSSGVLHWWDMAGGEVRSLPVLGDPPFHVLPVEQGRALLFASTNGPVLRADLDGLRPLSLATTPCLAAGGPVTSPRGGWIAWTCYDALTELAASQGVVVRVSALGLERFVGVPMTPLAIDDEGQLLLHSVQSIADDTLDGVDAQDSPRSLFVLSREGVLGRVDELEPQPVAVFVESSEFGAFLQAAAL